jgi:Ribonuclease G/E
VREFREQHGFTGGVIIRQPVAARAVVASSKTLQLHPDLDGIRQRWKGGVAPAVLFQNRAWSPLPRSLTDDYTAIRPDDPQEHCRVALIERIMPNRLPCRSSTLDHLILEEHRVRRRSNKYTQQGLAEIGWLPRQPQTEALVAIDVNTGAMRQTHRAPPGHDRRDQSRGGKEIVRQLRLRSALHHR